MKTLLLLFATSVGWFSFVYANNFVQPKHSATYWLRISSSASERRQVRLLSIDQDSMVVGLSGSSIVNSNNTIDFFSENGYTKTVGSIYKKGGVLYLKSKIVSRTISIIGEKLPTNEITTPFQFTSETQLLLSKSIFTKIDSGKVSYNLKRILANKR